MSDRVVTTDPAAIRAEIHRIYLDLFQGGTTEILDRAIADLSRLYCGEYPGYRACNTAYHDIQHVLDVTLAMARLMDGYERGNAGSAPLGRELFELGVIMALFHDCGYICARGAEDRRNGAEFTLTHVSRGGEFLRSYLPSIGLVRFADVAAELIHFTGYERKVSDIQLPDASYHKLGNLLGSADIIAQMADRCYLEKCRDRLYPEFVMGGIARRRNPDGSTQVVFSSAEDLLNKTPGFYQVALKRLEQDLSSSFVYAEHHFGGQNLYLEGVQKNVRFVERVGREGASILRRIPPYTLAGENP